VSGGRRVVFPSFPWRFGATPARRRSPAPALGSADPDSLVASWPDRVRGSEPPGPARLPLEGVRVLDLGTYWAGAGCTTYLGAIGADVIKVESVQRPDGWRFNMIGPALGRRPYERGRYRAVNLNKRGLTLNLAADEGRELFLHLVRTADVLVENYAARVMDRLRLGWPDLSAVNPRLVMLRMPGFGLAGPWRDYVGFGPSFVYASGHTALTGFPEGPPLNPGGLVDPMVATIGSFAILAALRHAERTGRGQLVEVPQIEVGACIAPEPIIRYSLTGAVLSRTGNRSGIAAPQGVYRARDDRHVALTVSSDLEWQGLVEAMGSPPWATDGRLAALAGRQEHHDRLDREIGAWVLDHDARALVGTLIASGVPAAVVADTGDFFTDPQLQARGYYEPVDHNLHGMDTYPGWPMRFGPEPRRAHRLPCPLLGEHNQDILGTELGLDADTLARLTRDRVIGTEPVAQ
jgi:crotonobetainyl-CoA:carnitine CoA-transferase CaiB-like acyl-CoA transferase